MEKWKPLNMELRSWVISHVLRLEQTSSSLVRIILRMFKKDSKTLGNTSSALSFKSKIDLLYDLEEIDTTVYNHLIKLMEIRNQFAHNSNAISFEELDNINKNINTYLEKFIPFEIDKEVDRETKLKAAFSNLFQLSAGSLLVLEIEYNKGIEKDIIKHINYQVVENIDTIWQNALGKNKENPISTPIKYMLSKNSNELDNFYSNFKISMSEFAIQELEKIKGENIKKVFKRKKTTDEIFTKLDKVNTKAEE